MQKRLREKKKARGGKKVQKDASEKEKATKESKESKQLIPKSQQPKLKALLVGTILISLAPPFVVAVPIPFFRKNNTFWICTSLFSISGWWNQVPSLTSPSTGPGSQLG